jgi:hypothetical protein
LNDRLIIGIDYQDLPFTRWPLEQKEAAENFTSGCRVIDQLVSLRTAENLGLCTLFRRRSVHIHMAARFISVQIDHDACTPFNSRKHAHVVHTSRQCCSPSNEDKTPLRINLRMPVDYESNVSVPFKILRSGIIQIMLDKMCEILSHRNAGQLFQKEQKIRGAYSLLSVCHFETTSSQSLLIFCRFFFIFTGSGPSSLCSSS